MLKKSLYLVFALPLILILAACSSLQIPGVSAAANQTQGQAQGANQTRTFDLTNQPVEQKLGIGILKLEGTSNAVTAAQAKTMLPLWKAVVSLSSSNNTSATEIEAVYTQIKDTLTPDQVKAIQDLKLTGQDIQTLMQQEGIQGGQFANGGGFGNLTADQRATRVAQFQQNGGAGGTGARANGGTGGNGARGFGGGGVPGGGFGGGNFGGGAAGQSGAQRTPVPGQSGQNSARRVGGMNLIFAQPVIKLLTQRAGA